MDVIINGENGLRLYLSEWEETVVETVSLAPNHLEGERVEVGS